MAQFRAGLVIDAAGPGGVTVMAAVHWLRVGVIIAEFNMGYYRVAR